MISKTIGATGDYATWAAFYAACPDPIVDSYTVTIQAGTYNEIMVWAKTMNANTVTVRAVSGATVIFDEQSTRQYGVNLSTGTLTVDNIEYRNSTEYLIRFAITATALTVRGVRGIGGTDGIYKLGEANNLWVDGCWFENQSSSGITGQSDSTHTLDVVGTTVHTSTSGLLPTNGINVAHNPDGSHGKVYGCRVTAVDSGSGPSSAAFRANAAGTANLGVWWENCRAVGGTYIAFRPNGGVGAVTKAYNCAVLRTAANGIQYAFFVSRTAYIYRCLVYSQVVTKISSGVYQDATSAVVVTNTGMINCAVGIQTTAGSTCNNSYNGYRSNTNDWAGAGTYNNPETGKRTGDPLLDSQDIVVPMTASDWWGQGTSGDGLPIHNPAGSPDIGCIERYRVEVAA